MGEKRVIEQIASDEIYNDDWFLKDSVLHDTTKVQPSVIKEYVNQGMATSQDLADEATARQNMDSQLASGIGQQMANLADFYDTTKSYVVGDVCVLQSGELLRCIAPTSGTFDNTKWEQVTVDELFNDLNFSADAISYDNTSSGLEADNVQDAIDEVLETAGKVDDIVSNGQSLVENKIADLSSLTAVGSASGDIATFPDGSDLPMPKLEVAIEPQQEGSGNPSPENIRPISGWDEVNAGVSGVNLFDINSCEIGYLNENGAFVPYSGFYCTPYLNIKPNITYSLAYNRINTSSGSGMRIAWYDKNKTFIRRDGDIESSTSGEKIITVTAPSNAYYCRCSLVGLQEKYILTIGTITDLSSYTPYDSNSHTYTIDLDGTRYGGKVDLVSGVMTVTHGYVDLGTLDWARNTDYTNPFFLVALSDKKFSSEDLVCSIYVYGKLMTGTTALNTISNLTINAGGNSNALYIRDDSYTDAATFKAAMNGVQLVYELATPLTIQLSPTVVKSLRGMNNVWADSGAILDAEYIRDMTAIIDYILEQLGN